MNLIQPGDIVKYLSEIVEVESVDGEKLTLDGLEGRSIQIESEFVTMVCRKQNREDLPSEEKMEFSLTREQLEIIQDVKRHHTFVYAMDLVMAGRGWELPEDLFLNDIEPELFAEAWLHPENIRII